MEILTYGSNDADIVLLQMIDEQEKTSLEEEIACIDRKIGHRTEKYLFCACQVEDWNRDLSPWEAPPVFGKEGFAGRAAETLACGLYKIVSTLA